MIEIGDIERIASLRNAVLDAMSEKEALRDSLHYALRDLKQAYQQLGLVQDTCTKQVEEIRKLQKRIDDLTAASTLKEL